MKTVICTMILGAYVLAPEVRLNAEEIHQHGAHVHGLGSLNVALEGHELFMELDTPAASVVGFEHEPENDEQAHQRHEALELLGAGKKMFAFPVTAGCSSHGIKVNGEEVTEQHEETGHHEEGGGGVEVSHGEQSGHSDIRATYHFKCDNPQKLNSIDVQLFDHFHGFEKIEVQLLTSQKQTATTLTPDNSNISF